MPDARGRRREREMGTRPGPAARSDDLNISQQSRSRAAEERDEKKALSISFFARVFSNFLFCLKTSLPPFFLWSPHKTQSSQTARGRRDRGGEFAKFYRIKPQRRLNWLRINLHHVIMAQARKNQVVTHEIKWYKSLKENFLGVCDIISCRG